MRDLSKSYIWYTKDWKADERVFNLSLAERGLYRELIDLCYAQQNRVPIDLQKWARMYNSTPLEIEKILTHLEVNLLVEIRSEYLSIPSVNKRVNAIKYGQKGGLQKAENQKLKEGGTSGGNRVRSTQYKDKDKDKDKRVPSWDEFKRYALSKEPNVNPKKLEHKYNAWVEAGWKAGKELRPIKVWKTTLLNTLPHITDEPKKERRLF